jgi:hypothetical protein
MRFVMFMYPGEDGERQAGKPDAKAMETMGKFNEELVKSGNLLSADGLHPSSKGARVRFKNGKGTVTDGPFTETKEIVGGFWIIQAKSKEEALEWARKIPHLHEGQMVEVRQVFEPEEFAGVLPDSEIKKEREWRDAKH